MKILIASDLHWPVLNGVATFSRNLAKGLAERGHEVVVIAPSQDGKKHTQHDTNHTIYRVRSTVFPFYQNFRISLTPQLEVRKIIQEFEPDIIHIQMPMWIGQAAMFFGNRWGIPVVTTSHAMAENLLDNLKKVAPLSRPINYMLSEYGLRFHSKADAVTSPTRSGLDVFGDRAERMTKPLYVISNGIDLAQYEPRTPDPAIYKTYALPTDVPIVTYIGRVDAEKHLSVLLHAFKLVREHAKAHLLIVGSGVDLNNLQELANKLELDGDVTFAGRVSDEDKLALEQVGSLYAISSPAELQSIAMLEAMACGQPVVAVDAGALGELCHNGENGYLFGLDNYHEMANGITKILQDPGLRADFSRESLAIAKTHDLQHTLDQFIELYEQTIATKQEEVAARPAGWRERLRDNEIVDYLRRAGAGDDDRDE